MTHPLHIYTFSPVEATALCELTLGFIKTDIGRKVAATGAFAAFGRRGAELGEAGVEDDWTFTLTAAEAGALALVAETYDRAGMPIAELLPTLDPQFDAHANSLGL